MRWLWLPCVAVLGVAGASAATSARRDPDWPCVQVKVSELSLASFWSGPPIDVAREAADADDATRALVARLAQRRTPVEQASAEIAAFAAKAGPDKQARLLTLMAGLFERLNTERASVLAGLDRFGRRQKQLAESIRAQAASLREQQSPASAEQTEHMTWDTRLFEDRRQSLSAACEIPSIIEQRLFALAKAIEAVL